MVSITRSSIFSPESFVYIFVLFYAAAFGFYIAFGTAFLVRIILSSPTSTKHTYCLISLKASGVLKLKSYWFKNVSTISKKCLNKAMVPVSDGEAGRCLDPEGNGVNPGGGMGEGSALRAGNKVRS
jgi:hypothetical protein